MLLARKRGVAIDQISVNQYIGNQILFASIIYNGKKYKAIRDNPKFM